MKKLAWLAMLLVLGVGCATPRPRPKPMTQAEIISLAKAGIGDDVIIHQLQATRTILRLAAGDIVRLRQEGVSERVVNHLLDSYTRAAVAEQRARDAYDYRWHYGIHYWHPWHW
jgi:hypothetical protein